MTSRPVIVPRKVHQYAAAVARAAASFRPVGKGFFPSSWAEGGAECENDGRFDFLSYREPMKADAFQERNGEVQL